MKPTNYEKLAYAQYLLKHNFTYREIQNELKNKFQTGLSNTTLKKFQEEMDEIQGLAEENRRLKEELVLFKNLYYELLEIMKSKI